MKYRIAEFCELPEKVQYGQQVPFRLGNPEFFNEQLFKDPGMLSPADQRASINGITQAAKVLDCDFVIINPPQYYRVLMEMSIAEEGMVPVYPEIDVSPNGHLHLIRFKAGEHIPKDFPTPRLEEEYRVWKAENFVALTEETISMCQDPWRMFVDREIRRIFQRSVH